MKIINLGRGQGKTTRLLYASEFNDSPILCANMAHKNDLIHRAKELNLLIPEPICVHELFSNYIRGKRIDDILVDDMELVFQQMLHNIGLHSDVKAITLTEKEKNHTYLANREKLEKYDKQLRDYIESGNVISNAINELSDALSTTKCWDISSGNSQSQAKL